jgi:hypothetical protein
MVRLQHRFRRGPGEGITVGQTRYLLDEQGFVEVTEEHAGYMLAPQGTQWAESWPEMAPPAPPEATAGGRRPRTREEMYATMVAEGLAPETPPVPKLSTSDPLPGAEDTVGLNAGVMAGHPEDDLEEDEEVIEISLSTPLLQLKKVAAKLGVPVPKKATQAQLFELLQQQPTEGD